MARRVILDTGVIIAFERGRLDIGAVLGADDAAIAAVTAMELLVEVERADETHRQRRPPKGIRCGSPMSFPGTDPATSPRPR
jgi:predicted nucleic acid-binding protein